MANIKTVEKYSSDISSIWHDAGMDGTEYVRIALFIMCLKKMIEENACTNPEHMPAIVKLTKSVYHPVSAEDIEVIRGAFELLEKAYNIKRGLLSDALNSFRSEEKAWENAFLGVVSATANIEVDEDGYYPYASKLINMASKDKRDTAEKISSNAVAELLGIAANVRDGETFLDGTIGYGYSSVHCIRGKKDITLYGVDIHTDSIQMATLYMVLCGVTFDLTQGDFTAMRSEYVADKVVMDIPPGMRAMHELTGYQLQRTRKWMGTDSCKEMECLFMTAALDAMKDNGRFVVIVPQNILFKQTKALSTLRRNLVKKGLLKAVVALPPVYNSTMVDTAMLVFEQGNEEVLFVDASSLVTRERRNDAYITEENKKTLGDILENKTEVENISFRVSNADVLETGDWSISKYNVREKGIELRSVAEIEKELRVCYKKLDELNAESCSIKLPMSSKQRT